MAPKITPRRIGATLAVTLAVPFAATASAGAQPRASAAGGSNVVETAQAAGQFKTLVSLVQRAGLADTLSGAGPFTVFAPTDKAFAKMPKKTLKALLKDKAKLRAVLLYHVATGKLTAKQVVKRSSVKTLNGDSLRIRVRGGSVLLDRAKVTTPNVMASNGVIHVINRVLIP